MSRNHAGALTKPVLPMLGQRSCMVPISSARLNSIWFLWVFSLAGSTWYQVFFFVFFLVLALLGLPSDLTKYKNVMSTDCMPSLGQSLNES